MEHPGARTSRRSWLHGVLLPIFVVAMCARMGSSATGVSDPGRGFLGPKSDQDDLVWMKSASPEAAAALLKGEELAQEGASRADLERAAALFRDASTGARASALAARRYCEALTALGRHDEAISACDEAMARGGKVPDLRAAVGALMSGPNAPTVSEAGRALYFARRATEILPEEPWGYAAQCDVAEKLGDTEMLTECTIALSRLAPLSPDTRRAQSALASARPGVFVVVGWIAALFVVVGTLAHAARRAFFRARSSVRTASTMIALLAFSVPEAVHAETTDLARERPVVPGHLSKYPIDEVNPESSVPAPEQRDHDPLEYGYFLMDLGDAAEQAAKHGDHAKAARFYRAIVKAVPDAAVGYRKACEQSEAASDGANAKSLCAAALTQKDAVLGDYSHYARIVFAASNLDPSDVQNLDAVIRHLKAEKASATVAWDIECNLGVRLGDVKRLEECTVPWAAVAPSEPKIIFYRWVLALHQKDYRAAMGFIAQAKAAKVARARVLHMEQATFQAMPIWRRGFRDWRFGAFVAALLAACLALLVVRSRREPTASNIGRRTEA